MENTYKERCKDQLKKWVSGNSIHNMIDDECCPDFSCCRPEMLQPKEIRETFKEVCKKADEEYNPDHHPYDDAKMGMSFIGNSFNKELFEHEESINRNLVADGAEKYCLCTKNESDLYRSLDLVIYENEEKYGYKLVGSGIGGGIDFSIVVPQGTPFPSYLGKLFMDIGYPKFKVKIKKTDLYKDRLEDHYQISII